VKQAARSRLVSHVVLPSSVLWRNRQTECRLVLRPKPRNRHGDFEAQTIAAGFEAQTGKPKPLVLRSNQRKLSPPVLRSNRRKPSKWFQGQNTDKPSTLVLRLNKEMCAPRLHVHGADPTQCHLTYRSPSHQVPDMCDHPRSSAPGLLLLPQSSSLHVMLHLPPAHHKTSKRDCPNETEIKVKLPKYLGFKFKPRQVNDSSQSNQGTDHLVSQSPP
jgi:hypothetical protein